MFRQAEDRKLTGYLLVLRRRLAFLKGDEAQEVRLAAAAMGEPGAEDQMLGALERPADLGGNGSGSGRRSCLRRKIDRRAR